MRKKISLMLPLLCALLAFWACGDGESNSGTSANGDSIVSANKKSIAGVSQKGPFVTGSAVKLYELDGETYAQTGKSFTGKITSDNGEFGVSSVTLASQYALLEASGYYRNEVSGKKSGGTITLNALTDLSDREKVNINLLTHLEYERALYLVGTGVNVPAAKKQAEAEIFNAFGIQGDFANSEDLNIFGEGEGDAALLALSILMQGDRSEAKLTELLTKFATDIEKDGEWNDASTKARIAEWANEQDLNGRLSSIRSNINSWGLGAAPDFEKYVRNFWYANYGLEACEADSKGVVAAATNELVEAYGTKTRYICNGEVWVEARDGYIKKDDSTDAQYKYDKALDKWVATRYKYDEALDKWVVANANDVGLGLMGCTTNRAGEMGKSGETYYVCKNSNWQEAAEIDYDTYGEKCSNSEVGKTMNGKETATNKYYCSSKGWVSLKGWSWDVPKEVRLNPEITYGNLTDSRDGQVYKTVEIGTQVWMAENLNYADSTKTPSLKGKSWCYDDKAENCDVTGRLYTWAAAIDSVALANDADNPQTCGYGKTCTLPTVVQGVCPSGWHLPTKTEWNTLFTTVGGSSAASKALKSGSGWDRNGNGKDTYGFSALPAGDCSNYGYCYDVGDYAFFWSASWGTSTSAYHMRLLYDCDLYIDHDAYIDDDSKNEGFSVRCLQDSN